MGLVYLSNIYNKHPPNVYETKYHTWIHRQGLEISSIFHPGRLTAGSPTAITHLSQENDLPNLHDYDPAVHLQGCITHPKLAANALTQPQPVTLAIERLLSEMLSTNSKRTGCVPESNATWVKVGLVVR